jgi:hypothetical protein
MAFHWTCPFCSRDTTIVDDQMSSDWHKMLIKNSVGRCAINTWFIVWPDPKCAKYTLRAGLHKYELKDQQWKIGDEIQSWNLIPASEAKIFPEYVPLAVRNDYLEACSIKILSPKASATLARRCLQGMIRDFCGISKGRLIDEINAIEDKVDPLTWKAIDAVRSVGNIGAHMEKDINVIVDVDPDEASQLIQLIEVLMKDWYITRHDRQERVAAVIAIAKAKQQDKMTTS